MSRSARPLSHLLMLRQRIVELYLQGTRNQSAIARELDVSRPTVARAIDLFKRKGLAGLTPAVRGRKLGAGRLLTPSQELAIRTRLHAGPPDPAAHGDSLWTRASVMALVRCEVGREVLSERALGDYLKRWGGTAGGANARSDIQGVTIATVAVSRRHMLWELLAWAPFSTAQVQRLALSLCDIPWQGRYLLWGLPQRWTFQRARQSLQRLYRASSARKRATSQQPPGFNIDAHWQSARREAWLHGLLSTHPHDEHWSLRVVPVMRVTVAHTRTPSRHVGPTPHTHTASPGLLLAAIKFDARPSFHVALIDDPVTNSDEERLITRCQTFFAALDWQPHARVRLHLPVGASQHLHYSRVLDSLDDGTVRVSEDMPPPFITPGAVATVDIPITVRRSRNGRQVLPATAAGCLDMDRHPPLA